LFLGDHAANMRDLASKHLYGSTKVSLATVRWIREHAALGCSQRELGLAVGLDPRHVGKIVRRESRPDTLADPIAKDKALSGRTKVSLDDVRWIRQWGDAGWSGRLLAQAVGCSRSLVDDVLARRTWLHA
jgi:hypothetical protein